MTFSDFLSCFIELKISDGDLEVSQALPLHPIVLDILGPGLTLHGDQDTILLTEQQISKSHPQCPM